MSLAPTDFDYLAGFLHDRSAIVIEPGKEYLVTSRLEPVAKSAGFAGIDELVRSVRRSPSSPLADQIVDAMTTNETLFFRDVHPFNALRDQLIPEIMNRRSAQRSISIWCAACSSGQEPYSLAMLLREHFPELASWRVRILATDLSPSMVERAKLGRFSQLEVGRGLPASLLVKYFERDGAQWVIDPVVRSMVTFEQLNLLDGWSRVGAMDLVMIRNVLIYFDGDTKSALMQRLHRTLAPSGILMVGASETVQSPLFERNTIDRTSYYRPTGEKP